jgi:hypothetical protein
MRRVVWAVGLVVMMVAIVPVQAAKPLSESSLAGSYGFRMTKFGTCPNIAAVVGILAFDGAGNVGGGATAYQSNPGGAGVTVVVVTLQGTYSVNADGTGPCPQ